jgi:AcrR family transcriptional regulator
MKPKKEKIIDTAIALFADNGFHNTSISQIANKAGVSKGLMYNYFESKEDLLKYIFDLGAAKLLENFDPNRDGVLTKEEFIFYIEDIFYQMQKDRNYWMLFFNIVTQPAITQIVADRMMEMVGPMMKELTDYFRNKGCEDPEAEARYFVAVMDGVGMHYLLDQENYPIRSVIKKIIKEFV